jgi:hypothetical protein
MSVISADDDKQRRAISWTIDQASSELDRAGVYLDVDESMSLGAMGVAGGSVLC